MKSKVKKLNKRKVIFTFALIVASILFIIGFNKRREEVLAIENIAKEEYNKDFELIEQRFSGMKVTILGGSNDKKKANLNSMRICY